MSTMTGQRFSHQILGVQWPPPVGRMGLECFLWWSIVSGEVEGLEPVHVIPEFCRGVSTNVITTQRRPSEHGMFFGIDFAAKAHCDLLKFTWVARAQFG